MTCDPWERAPAPEGDVSGMFSLGCVMENMWLMAQALGIGFMIMSVFGNAPLEKELMKAFVIRPGYPPEVPGYLRMRRDTETFTHHSRYGNKGID